MIKITQDDFTSRTGIDLASDLREKGVDNDKQADILITRWEKYVYKQMSYKEDNPTPNQIECIKDAVCSYGLFCLQKGDWETNHNGDDPTPEIKKTLRQCGLVVNSLWKGR